MSVAGMVRPRPLFWDSALVMGIGSFSVCFFLFFCLEGDRGQGKAPYALLTKMSNLPSTILPTCFRHAAMLAASVTSSWTTLMPLLRSSSSKVAFLTVAMTWKPKEIRLSQERPLM